MSTRQIHLVVPVKDPRDAKQRLSDLLNAKLRESLFRVMVADTFKAISSSRELASVNVVTRDPNVSALARSYGFETLKEAANDGHTTAVNRGFESLVTRGIGAAMTLPADMPCLTGSDIDTLVKRFDQIEAPDACLLVPAADFAGTNAAILAPPDLFEFSFGSDSFYPHVDAAKRAGVDPVIVENANIALDIDTPDDLRDLISRDHLGDQTRSWLNSNWSTEKTWAQ